MKRTPMLTFHIDETALQAARMEALIKDMDIQPLDDPETETPA